jgi:hypothetical protein
MFRAALLKSYSQDRDVELTQFEERNHRRSGGKLFPLESAAGFDERMHRKVKADHGEDSFNRGALMIGKVVFMVLAHQRRGAEDSEKHKYQAGGLEPEGVKRAAHGHDKRFSAGKDRIEQAVFLYNALQSIFYRGDLCHFGYCSAKIGGSAETNKTHVTRRASNLGSPERFA